MENSQRDFFPLRLQKLRDDTKDRVSEKLYYKFLHLSTVSGIPYHSGYFRAYGSPDTAELSDSIVDFLCPKSEIIKKYASEILMRNECQTFDLKLSWLKEKDEICLWNGNSSLEYKKPENGNEEIETVNEFYPCFIKRYSMVDEGEKITEIFFLEDKYLVVKLKKKLEAGKIAIIFRILNLEEEFRAIAKGLEPAIPFDYSFIRRKGDETEIKANEYGVDFAINQESGYDIKVKLLLDDRAVFYTESTMKPTLIFWELKEKKKIDFVSVELQKPLNNIIVSKKSEGAAEKIKVFILDENMNVYCGSISEKDGFILSQTIILPIKVEEKIEKSQEDIEKLKELEAKYNLNFAKKIRSKYTKFAYPKYLPADSFYDLAKQVDPQLSRKTRRYYHEIWNKTNEEWLIVHMKNNFHFVNLDKEKIQEFSSDKKMGDLESGNWTVYEDTLLITNPEKIRYFKINFEDQTIRSIFSREIKPLLVEKVVKQWIVLDPCFTVIVFTHANELGFATRVSIVVTSTQEFLYNKDPAFNLITFKAQADQFILLPDRWENRSREIDLKFDNSKVLVSTEKASFYFDMTLSAQPYSKVYLNGWLSKNPIEMIRYTKVVASAIEPEVLAEEEEMEEKKPKMVNYMKLEGNQNILNAKEKHIGWNKNGKSQAKKDEDKEYRVLKGKGDKYQKNIRQGQRSDKMN